MAPQPQTDDAAAVLPRSTRPRAAGASDIPTMRDIARQTGVSQSTVSRVLSGVPTPVPIAQETRQRVLEVARSLGYRPNPHARGLRGAPTMLLGVIVREITDPFFAAAIEAVSIEASRRGYNVVLGHAHARADEALALWGILEARHCDAILIFGDMRDELQLIEDLHDARVPVVALWHGSRAAGIPTVTVDNRAGIDAVVDHLVALGHRRIAFIGGRRLGDIREREEAYVEGLVRNRIHVADAGRVSAANDHAGGAAALCRLLELPDPPTAVVAATDVLAIGALHQAWQQGLVVGRDLSITGFDDIPVAAVSNPALTTVRMPVREMVATGMRMVIGEDDATLDGVPTHPVHQPQLIIRDSTGPAPG